MGRGENLKKGSPAGDKGRSMGGSASRRAFNARPAPEDCEFCKQWGYTRMAQHLGHLGFAAYLRNPSRPSLRGSLKRCRRGDFKKGRRYV